MTNYSELHEKIFALEKSNRGELSSDLGKQLDEMKAYYDG